MPHITRFLVNLIGLNQGAEHVKIYCDSRLYKNMNWSVVAMINV